MAFASNHHCNHRSNSILIVLCIAFQVWAVSTQAADSQQLEIAISKAVSYLAVEVPKWQTEHSCASCHNQGDAVRALVEGHRQKFIDNTLPLDSTFTWLSAPNEWKNNHGAAEFNDPKLATVQFAGALLASKQHWGERFDPALAEAAVLIANLQQTDGSWNIDGGGLFASPITHGTILLSDTGMQILKATDKVLYKRRIERAEQWLSGQQARNPLEASSLLIALRHIPAAASQRSDCLAKLVAAQGGDGGFGPHSNASAEVFDTALAVLALSTTESLAQVEKAIQQGADYLLKMQEDPGYWNETTRPSGVESYAHRISTTGWATQSLLAVRQRILDRDQATSKQEFGK